MPYPRWAIEKASKAEKIPSMRKATPENSQRPEKCRKRNNALGIANQIPRRCPRKR
jgi:hypothetical protein